MKTLKILTQRNSKLFFKDKGMFFSSLITPVILLVLYASFLLSIYRDSISSAIPDTFGVSPSVIDALAAGQLASSLLAVCCVTIAFCSNLLMIQDKVTGAIGDLTVSPVKRSVLGLSYFLSSAFVTLVICLTATVICFIYISTIGWYLSAKDVLLILLDVILLTVFGVALSSCVNFFLSTQGQLSAVGMLVSVAYGFICGAYMPIASFSEGLRSVLMYLPGSYATSLLHNHWMNGAFAELSDSGVPAEIINGLRDGVDCNLYFAGDKVEISTMYAVLLGAIILALAIYIAFNVFSAKHRNRR